MKLVNYVKGLELNFLQRIKDLMTFVKAICRHRSGTGKNHALKTEPVNILLCKQTRSTECVALLEKKTNLSRTKYLHIHSLGKVITEVCIKNISKENGNQTTPLSGLLFTSRRGGLNYSSDSQLSKLAVFEGLKLKCCTIFKTYRSLKDETRAEHSSLIFMEVF